MFAQKRFVLGIVTVLALLVVGTPAAVAEDLPAPVANTLPATDVSGSAARLRADIATNGTPTTAYFVYGTAIEQLDQRTPDVALDSTEIEPLSAWAADLTPDTTYYFAPVAENADWNVTGDTYSFHTPAVPQITGSVVDGITTNSAVLHLHVDTNGLPGVTITGQARLGTIAGPFPILGGFPNPVRFGPVPVPPGGDVAIPLTRLAPGATYSWSAGTTDLFPLGTTTGSFTTAPRILAPAPQISSAKAAYGTHVTVSGTIPRPNAKVALATQPAALTPAPPVASMTADATGAYAFDVLAERSVLYGVMVDDAVPLLLANMTKLQVFPAVTARLRRAPHHRFRVSGSYAPRVVAWVSLFRLGAGRVDAARASSGTFRFPAWALKPGRYEVRVTPPKSARLAMGKSATITVPRRGSY